MELLPLLLKFLIFIYCVNHLLENDKPRKTAFIYASVYAVISIVYTLFSGSISASSFVTITADFIFDFLYAYLWFWLMHRYKANKAAFYSIITIGIIISSALKFWAVSLQ
ncbi:hypothetical protein A3744_02000 [Oleiphilus sp. HI0073]|nr:hypothetical protein A3737_05695 [Oleiphilus sp. HI0065]KZY92503.1 hypothetical protein A3744_02000 [Oleiphilus sp. HI0073]KZZ60992.1 hypothetical protein A3760_04610 [Oleiphilus sp. HI0122]